MEDIYCECCGGPGMELGGLGQRMHYRCRDCGIQWSILNKPLKVEVAWTVRVNNQKVGRFPSRAKARACAQHHRTNGVTSGIRVQREAFSSEN